MKNVENIDLEDTVFRMELEYHEIAEILDKKYRAATSIGCTLQPGIYEISNNYLMLKSLLPDDIKVNITIDDIRLTSNLATKKQSGLLIFRLFLYHMRVYSNSLRSFR